MPPRAQQARPRNVVLFTEEQARAVLLVRAVEEADREGRELTMRARRGATDAALSDVGDAEPALFLDERSRLLMEGPQGSAFPTAGPLERAGRVPPSLLVGGALVLGLSSNLLGASRQIHLLWNPVLALVAWSLGAYVFQFLGGPIARLLGGGSDPSGTPGLTSFVSHLAQRVRARLAGRPADGSSGTSARVRVQAWTDFTRAFAGATMPLRLARVRFALHVGAALVALGAVGGMYLRGLVFEYRATWESTFLDADGVEAVLRFLLTPALLASSAELPPLAAESSEVQEAAPWVHLFAWTVALVVLLPRALLALYEARRVRRLGARIPLDLGEPYFRRLLAPGRGEATSALVKPYSLSLETAPAERLRSLLSDLLGSRTNIQLLPSASYGDEDGAALFDGADAGGNARTLVLVFPLAQTPEAEVHGRLLNELRGHLAEDESLLILVDASRYRARLGAQAEGRLDERRSAWDRMLGDEGLSAAHVDLEVGDADAELNGLSAALWSPGASASVASR
ncbi:MAG: DUF2868 domain-containing protein [Planctomycetota bacterium]